ncbi:MAG: hypothetical protein FK734_19960 [Asgard group archaeon]|nr:hypothetical protein [Asgard group archaeon]
MTNPNEKDTDGDSFDDNVEIAEGTDPTDPLDYPITPSLTPTPSPTITETSGISLLNSLFLIVFSIFSVIFIRRKYSL